MHFATSAKSSLANLFGDLKICDHFLCTVFISPNYQQKNPSLLHFGITYWKSYIAVGTNLNLTLLTLLFVGAMATTKYQGFPTYRYAQIALKGSNRVPQVIGDIRNINTNFESKEEVIQNPEEMNTQIAASHSYDMSQQNFSSPQKEPEFEVNYDNNVTALYQAISNSQWDVALETLQSNPQEARTWVVRYKEDNTKGIMWRFLPLHSACARQPPNSVLSSLLQAFPEGAGSCDDQGMVSYITSMNLLLYKL